MKQLIESYLSSYNQYKSDQIALDEKLEAKRAKIHRLERQVQKLRDGIYKMPYPSWIDMLVKPLAEELARRTGKHYEIYGPFGIRSQTSIYLKDNPNRSIVDQDTGHLSLVPTDLDSGILYYETGEVKNRFAQETVGDVNGMNNVTAPLPDDFDEIEKLIRWSIEEKKGEL